MNAGRTAVAAVALVLAMGQAMPVAGQSVEPDEAMLPTEAESGLEFLTPPQTNRTDEGRVASVSATYKAPPAAGEPIDPRPVCEGAGWTGEAGGYGPNLCIDVTLSAPEEPCPECDDLAAVRERFPRYAGTTSEQPAPDPCVMLVASDPASPPEWPCVGPTTVFERGAEISGFENLDRNTHMVHFRLIGAVDGIAVSIGTRYFVYTSDRVVLDHMADRVRELGAVVATQVRQQLELRNDDGNHDSGGGDSSDVGGNVTGDGSANAGQPGTSSTVNDLPVEDVAPFAVIGALAAIAAVAATIGATGGTLSSATGGAAATPPLPAAAPPPVPAVGTFIDPDTGESLPVENGKVWWGEWMSPDEAQTLIDQRTGEIELDQIAAAQHQDFVQAQQAIRDDRMQSHGFRWNDDSQSWVATDVTNAVLDAEWLEKMADDPAWNATQQQFADIQHRIDAGKKAILTAHDASLQSEHDLHVAQAKVADWMYGGTKFVQGVADTSINVLATVTGPAGQSLKQKYTFLKTFCGELSEKGVSVQTVVTATLKGASDVAMDEVGGRVANKLGTNFGDGPNMSDSSVSYVTKKLLASGPDPNYAMRRYFGPGVKSAVQGEVLNLVGWRPLSDDTKAGLGVVSGDRQDLDKMMKESTFLHRFVQQKLIRTPTMIGGPL